MIGEATSMDETSAVHELVTAHADMERLTADLSAARERRRAAARRLIELGHGTSWIARQLDVSPQAVDSFLKYKRENP
jgi:antirestriction protein ArdC